MTGHILVLLFFIVNAIGAISANHGSRGCSNGRWFRVLEKAMECGKHQSGYHRHDQQVAFMARFSSNNIGKSRKHEIVIFNNIITNTGNGYSGTTGIFICPSQGVYSFSWSILSYRNQHVYTELVLNGNIIMANHAESVSRTRTTCTTNAVLHLKKGDRVWIRRYNSQSSGIHGERWSSFQGFKL